MGRKAVLICGVINTPRRLLTIHAVWLRGRSEYFLLPYIRQKGPENFFIAGIKAGTGEMITAWDCLLWRALRSIREEAYKASGGFESGECTSVFPVYRCDSADICSALWSGVWGDVEGVLSDCEVVRKSVVGSPLAGCSALPKDVRRALHALLGGKCFNQRFLWRLLRTLLSVSPAICRYPLDS